jgi:hypothetical protein
MNGFWRNGKNWRFVACDYAWNFKLWKFVIVLLLLAWEMREREVKSFRFSALSLVAW